VAQVFAGKAQRCWKLYTPQEFSSVTSAARNYTALLFEKNTNHSSFSRTKRPLKKEQMVKRFHRKTGAYHGMIYFKRPLISVKTKKNQLYRS
jgi:hypothetical protein